jgi:hypothetical protein
MIQFTVMEFVLFWAALVVAFYALRPHVPAWALFALNALFSIHWLVKILDDGPRVMEVVLLALGVFVAVQIWWRDLRGSRNDDVSVR